jgi:lipopolysaccharide transport system ATP-binding protein
MPVAIKIENISKQYRLGLVGTGTLSHDLRRWWHLVRGKEDPYLKIGEVNDRSTKGTSDYIWALKDINFEVQQGEVLGIIGKNGAGKSTLLKVLSKVTAPTTGSITYKGRIGSLLEVGTGFNPELTGRENIFLNGAILGMRRREIDRKFDEIVEFSGCERYIDTPVKRYSSGMTVRLGFAVAAFLEPEILVVDEVLAVGDAEFQKKAIGKMQDVSRKEGRTVLFVSHNMAAVKSLCSRGIILENGLSVFQGDIETCVSKYLKGNNDLTNHKAWNRTMEIMNEDFELIEIGVRGKGKDYCELIRIDEPVEFIAIINQKNPNKRIDITLHIKDDQGNKLFSTGSGLINNAFDLSKGYYQMKGTFPANFFNWGSFYIDLYIIENRRTALVFINDIISFTLSNKEQELGSWMGREPGGIMPTFDWEKEKLII